MRKLQEPSINPCQVAHIQNLRYEQLQKIEYFHACSGWLHIQVEECGLFINLNHPFIGASPDGLVTCACCGEGVCEIKVC